MIGQRINNYEIVEEIGAGGMGTVYLARHPFIQRKVAVKVLHPELVSSEDVATRFLNEALAANAIGHPNIIDILDAGRLPTDGTPYLMMEFLDGESLAQRIRRDRGIPVPDALAYTRQVASALGAAHAKGIVHRDLKPENLFLVGDPRSPGQQLVKVLDFGIAKVHGSAIGKGVHTRTGMVMGTPPYMSPEQCRGAGDETDHRTDIYALGIIAYEMLCGAPPFVAQTAADMLFLRLTQEVLPPRKKNPGVPRPFERAIIKALARRAEDRFGSMEELYLALPAPEARPEARPADAKASRRIDAGQPGPDPAAAEPMPAPSPGRAGSAGNPAESAGLSEITTLSSVTGQNLPTAPVARRRALPLLGGAGLALVGGFIVFAALGTKKVASPSHPAPAQTSGPSVRALPITLPAAPPVASPQAPPTGPAIVFAPTPPPTPSPDMRAGKPSARTSTTGSSAGVIPKSKSPRAPPSAVVGATSPPPKAAAAAPAAAVSGNALPSKKSADPHRSKPRPKAPAAPDDAPIKF